MRSFVLHVGILSGAVACGSNEPSEDPTHCAQTYEFGNTGCGELQGLVTDSLGVPFADAYVDVRGPADPGRPVALSSGFVPTDSAGNYMIRVIRDAGDAPAEGPDTVTVWVHAAVPPPGDAPVGTPGPRDSVLATLELRPVGETPVVREVVPIVLAAP